MSTPKKLVQIVHNLCRLVVQIGRTLTRKVMQWLLRTLMKSQRSHQLQKGFVLPTVTMVMLVVVLLTTAIMLRSFDRSKNASNYRVNQAVMNASEPALDRAKQKLNELFDPSSGTRGTPSEIQFNKNLGDSKYTFADETRLQLAYDIDGNGSILDDPNSDLRIRETNVNAWRFPVDTDNNGKYDSFTLYGINFRSPTRDATGFNRKRNPLEARTPPMDDGSLGGFCAAAAGTSASLVGSSDWYESGGSLKKPFFIYVATVPITDYTALTDQDGNDLSDANYENYKGNQGFSALEYQQDRSVAPPSNNAVLYEDDLDIFAGPGLRLNGRVFTNSNLFVTEFNYGGQNPAGELEFYQVSSDESCFYNPENSKIIVAGNTGYGDASTNSNDDINRVFTNAVSKEIRVDLFQGRETDPTTNKTLSKANKSVTQFSAPTAYNTQAYEWRIQWLTDTALAGITNTNNDPEAVTEKKEQLLADDPTGSLTATEARKQAMEIYFRNRTRRVPFEEVPFDSLKDDAIKISGSAPTASNIQDLGGPDMRPPDVWIYPFDPTDGQTSTNYSELTLNTTTTGGQTTLLPQAIPPDVVEDNNGQETLVGDRVLVGNGLPAVWPDEEQEITDVKWHENATTASTETRYRQTRSEPLRDLDIAGRDGFWEQKAVESPPPENPLAGVGGLRIITGAGIYLPDDSTSTTQVVWPDWMPVPDTSNNDFITDIPADQSDGDLNDDRPYLRMRATAVYHYTNGNGRTPIACVSSFYDPTTSETARNTTEYTYDSGSTEALSGSQYDVSGISAGSTGVRTANANSLNGITYGWGPVTVTDTQLTTQANLFYPNGRLVNPQLKAAADKSFSNLSLAEQAAVDSTRCAFGIFNGNLSPNASQIPHGTIKEVAFLDGRQVKLIDQVVSDTSTGDGYNPAGFDMTTQVSDFSARTYYNYPIEQRYPLEIRATEIDLDLLRKQPRGSGEYLFPNSGIIYATRDDALPDQSDANLKVSATDFKLDPTRRPNGIVLINGEKLWRTQDYRQVEKGLTLASNLPVYIKGDFNLHDHEEFTTPLAADWNNFYSRTQADLNESFACRQGDPRLPDCLGDDWRAANVISDAITLLSDGFRYGFRDEGDYDLRNNRIDNIAGLIESAAAIRDKRKAQGFLNNNFVTSHYFQDADYRSTSTTPLNSSYFNNYVTPIQRRVLFPEYVMEICRKLPVSECTADDWVTGYDDGTVVVANVPASKLAAELNAKGLNPFTSLDPTKLVAGTTATPALSLGDRRFPRRVAFLRYWDNNPSDDLKISGTGSSLNTGDAAQNVLVLDNNTPIPLGIGNTGKLQYYPYRNNLTIGGHPSNKYANNATDKPGLQDNALWFANNNNQYSFDYPLAYTLPTNNTGQPLLTPVLQIHVTDVILNPDAKFSGLESGNNANADSGFANIMNISTLMRKTQWLMHASGDTTFNLLMATGDNPSRPPSGTIPDVTGTYNVDVGESNGGLANLARFIESWDDGSTANINKISGSFIQLKRSQYATAPFWQLQGGTKNNPIIPPLNARKAGPFNYPQMYRPDTSDGKSPFFAPPKRQWGFDVGLLSQSPDLFSQQFAQSFEDDPSEFFREVSRDDDWVQTLLCAKAGEPQQDADGKITYTYDHAAINANQRPTSFCDDYTGG